MTTSDHNTRASRIIASGKFLVVGDPADPSSIVEKSLSAVRDDYYQSTEGKDYLYHPAFCYPVSVKLRLTSIIEERKRLKDAYDDSMALLYQLNNAIARGEL